MERFLREFAKNARSLTLRPKKTLAQLKPRPLGYAFRFYLIVIIIASVLSNSLVIAKQPLLGLASAGLEILVGALVVWLGAAYFHIWVYALGGRRIEQTFKIFLYAVLPSLYLWFGQLLSPLAITVVSLIGGIWSLLLTFIGLRVFYGFSRARAAATILLAFLPIIILIALVIWAVGTLQVTQQQLGTLPGIFA